MSNIKLTLDAVVFKEFEIPDGIKAGGAQSLFRHKYPGGSRTIDAMGPDDDDISWTGVFLDDTAQDRCNQLDIIRRQGKPVVVAWAGYRYLMVVASFTWDFKRTWHIPYTITLAVLEDQTKPSLEPPPDIGIQSEADISDAQNNDDMIVQSIREVVARSTQGPTQRELTTITDDATAVSVNVAGLQVMLGSVSSITTASVDFQKSLGVQAGIAAASSKILQSNLSAAVSKAGAQGLFASGSSPTDMAVSLTNLKGLATALAAATSNTDLLGRLSKNIGQLGK